MLDFIFVPLDVLTEHIGAWTATCARLLLESFVCCDSSLVAERCVAIRIMCLHSAPGVDCRFVSSLHKVRLPLRPLRIRLGCHNVDIAHGFNVRLQARTRFWSLFRSSISRLRLVAQWPNLFYVVRSSQLSVDIDHDRECV